MSLSIGIVGLPNVGKSTLFKALTKKAVSIAPYPFTTIHPNLGIVQVPDERLRKIAEIIKPEKITPAQIEFVDIAGLVKGAHKGEGLGNQFLSQIRNCDAILMVIRAFFNEEVENVLGEINPQKEIEILKTELLMKDLETLERIFEKLEKEKRSAEKRILKKLLLIERIKNFVSQGKLISEISLSANEKKEIREYQFLTEKPMFFLLNVCSRTFSKPNVPYLEMNLKEEAEFSALSEKEQKELGVTLKLDKLILACYNVLDLITFFTVAGGKEVRAWSLKRGENVLEAAAKVHSDFQEKFIRAEVIGWENLVKAGSWVKAKERGLIKTLGKEYVVQDGDVIEFKI